MKLDCQNCGAMCGHWLVVEVPAPESGAKSRFKCICRQCGAIWLVNHNPLKDDPAAAQASEPEMTESFGVEMPPGDYYLHRGHAWAALEESGEVRVGLDDFSQKILGLADELKLPEVGTVLYQDHICMALGKKGNKASFEAPVDGMVTEVNPKIRQNPRLLHDDPYGAGWVLKIKPTNLKHNLATLISGEKNEAWTCKESHRLLHLMNTTAGVTLPSGGALIDDIYGHFPQIGWRRLAKEFFLTSVTRHWQKRV